MGGKYRIKGYTSGQQKPLRKDGGMDAFGHCAEHDKTSWTTRKAARRAAKNRHPEGGKSPYRCPYTNGWHYGTHHFSRDTYRGVADGEEDPRREVDEGELES